MNPKLKKILVYAGVFIVLWLLVTVAVTIKYFSGKDLDSGIKNAKSGISRQFMDIIAANKPVPPAVTAPAETAAEQPVQANAGGIAWVTGLQQAFQISRESGKPIMADFYTEWCGWCKKLDADTYSNPEVIALSKDFVCIKIDADSDKASAASYGVTGYPTIVFLSPEGRILKMQVGYVKPDVFLGIMRALKK